MVAQNSVPVLCAHGCPRNSGDTGSGGELHQIGYLWYPDQDDRDSRNPLKTRGEWAELWFRCESCPGLTVLALGNHKGTLYAAVFGGDHVITLKVAQ